MFFVCHSDPGVVGLLPYSAEGRYRLFYGLIVDGFHTHDASVRLAYAMHPDGESSLHLSRTRVDFLVAGHVKERFHGTILQAASW